MCVLHIHFPRAPIDAEFQSQKILLRLPASGHLLKKPEVSGSDKFKKEAGSGELRWWKLASFSSFRRFLILGFS